MGDTHVLRLERTNEGFRATSEAGETIDCRAIVLATGPISNPLFRSSLSSSQQTFCSSRQRPTPLPPRFRRARSWSSETERPVGKLHES